MNFSPEIFTKGSAGIPSYASNFSMYCQEEGLKSETGFQIINMYLMQLLATSFFSNTAFATEINLQEQRNLLMQKYKRKPKYSKTEKTRRK